MANASWRDALRINLHSRLTQRVLVQLSVTDYRNENDLYHAASNVAWEIWFTPKQTFKIDITAQHSPLTSLNFAALKIKDAVADRFRAKRGERPSVDTTWPDVRIYAHLTPETLTLYIDTSGEPLFKRGWRTDKGDAPLKETLAAAMIAASGWDGTTPLYDPCCGSGTIPIEAAQIACGIAPGLHRRFGFENCCLSRTTSGKACSKKPTRHSTPPPRRSLAAMWLSAWSTLPSATPSAQACRTPLSSGVATPCSACRPARPLV